MRFAAPFLTLLLVACSTSGQDPKTPGADVDEDGGSRPSERRGDGGPSIASEIGALDEDAVKATFREARSAVTKCLRDANDGLEWPVVGGELEIQLRVKGDGSVRWVYPMRSTLGSRKAEKCVLSVLKGHTWPKPEGGDEGLARTDYGIDPPGREPTQWSFGDLGGSGSKAKSKLRSCMSDAGAASLSVTMYVDPDGKVLTAGGAVGDENGTDAIDCGIDAVAGMSFPTAGSYPAKVTITVK